MKGGKNCFLLVHVEGLCTHISQQQYLTLSHKRQRRERGTPSLLQKGQRLLRSRDGDDRQASKSGCCSPHRGNSFSRLSPRVSVRPSTGAGDTRSTHILLCSVLPPGPWSQMASHTPSFLLFLSLSPFLSLPFSVKGLL